MIPKRYIKSMILPVLFIIIWQMLSISIDNAIILPRVDSITELLIRPTQDLLSIGSLIDNTIISVIRVIIGYIIAAIVAITLGMIIGYSHKLDEFLLPFLSIFRPIAPLAWVPLVLAWFGVSSLATITGVEQGSLYIQLNNIKLSMLFIIFIGAFFLFLQILFME